MATTKTGIKAILFGSKGTMTTTTVSNPLAVGVKKDASFVEADANLANDDYNRAHSRGLAITIEAESLQAPMSAIERVFTNYLYDGGCDAQVVLPDRKTTGNFRAINLNGNRFIGLNVLFELSSTNRSIKYTGGVSLEPAAAKLLHDDRIVATQHPWLNDTLNGLGTAGIVMSKVLPPDLLTIESPIGTLAVSKEDIISRKLTMQGVADAKSDRDREFVDRVKIDLELNIRDATVEKTVAWLRSNRFPSVKLVETVPGGTEVFLFNAATLGLTVEAKRSSKDAYISLKFSAEIPLLNIDFDTDGTETTMTVNP